MNDKRQKEWKTKSQSHILMGYHSQRVLQNLVNDSTQLFRLLSELGRGAHLKKEDTSLSEPLLLVFK